MNKIREILSAGIIAGASVLGVTGCKGEESMEEKCARVPHSVHDIDGICEQVRTCCGVSLVGINQGNCGNVGSFCLDSVRDCSKTQEYFKDNKECGIIASEEVARLCKGITDKCVSDNNMGRDYNDRGKTGSHAKTCVELVQECGKAEGKTAAK
jgi:hypothetical protein